MNVKRRNFLKTLGTGAILSSLPSDRAVGGQEAADEQALHTDYQSNTPGVRYFLIGNGLIFGALQAVDDPARGTHCGLLVMSPEHFGRKISTYLYHPERGLQNSRCQVRSAGTTFLPEPSSSKVFWDYSEGVPTIVAEWQAGPCSVREEFFCPVFEPAIIRTVSVTARSSGASDVSCTVLLYPNLMFFDEYDVDRARGVLTASGYKTLRLFSSQPVTVGDRHMTVKFGSLPPTAKRSADFILTLDRERGLLEQKSTATARSEARQYWKGKTKLETGDKTLDHLFRVSVSGIRSAVAKSGKMDGSIWQYNLEWVRDQSMVAAAAVMAGFQDIAEALLSRVLSQSVDDDGKTVDASRHRPPETIELDQNGELLYSLYTHWTWSGDRSMIRKHWKKIKNVADYVLRPEFYDPSIGLVKNTREYWEREASFGVREGYENAYQVWNIVGLQMASEMASGMNDSGSASRWLQASTKMKESYLHHPKFSLVDQGRLIKRRLSSGEVQRVFEPANRAAMPAGMPLNVESVSYCDPDTSCVLPIAFGIVDASSSLALNTLESMEVLWNQRWKEGGYGRYHVTSEPDSPGPWPFPSLFVARAYHEAGNDEKVWRALHWLMQVQGGDSGGWFEFYGDRPTPPLPPVGIVVWTWAELVTLVVSHLFGLQPKPDVFRIRPRLLTGLSEISGEWTIRGKGLRLRIIRDDKDSYALVNERRIPLVNGAMEIPVPERDAAIEMHIKG